MNDNISSICLLNNTGLYILIWQIGAFLFPILGIPGHLILISTILTSNRQRSHPTSLYFIFISLIESIYLVFLFWDWLDVVNLARDPRQILNCAFFYPFVSGTGYISSILLILLNFERISIINKPQQIHSHLTHKRILIKILLSFSILLFYIFHYHFSLYYDLNAFVIFGQSCRVYKHAHVWFYSIWPYIHLFSRLILCLILILCTLYICYNRYQENYDRKMLIHQQQQTFSLVLVLLSIYTFLAVIPISILHIFNEQMWKYEIECIHCNCTNLKIQANKWKLLNTLCIMWEASIYMNKFYVRFIFSSEFRYDVKRLIFCRSASEFNPKVNSIVKRITFNV